MSSPKSSEHAEQAFFYHFFHISTFRMKKTALWSLTNDPDEKKKLKAEMYASNNNIYHLSFVRPQNLWKINNSLGFLPIFKRKIRLNAKKRTILKKRWLRIKRKKWFEGNWKKKTKPKTDLINLLKMFDCAIHHKMQLLQQPCALGVSLLCCVAVAIYSSVLTVFFQVNV